MSGPRTLQPWIRSLDEHGDKPAVVVFGRNDQQQWPYGQLADAVARLGGGLAESGVGHGDRVAILASPTAEWIATCLATIDIGAAPVPIDTQLDDEPLRRVLEDSEPQLLITSGDHLERLEQAQLPLPRIVLLDAGEDDERSWRRLHRQQQGPAHQVEPDDIAVLFYTSGTTGPPKGVPLTHANLAHQLNVLVNADLLQPSDRALLPLPLHHVYPFVIGMLTPLALGLPIVLPRSLTGPQIVRAIREGEATAVVGVPRLYRALYAAIESRIEGSGVFARTAAQAAMATSTRLARSVGLLGGKQLLRPVHKQFGPQLRLLASGGSPLDEDLAWKLEGIGWQVAIGYGLTETSPLLTIKRPGDRKMDTVGRPVDGVEIRIDPAAHPEREADGQTAESTDDKPQEGEILARGLNIFHGYRHLPEKTKKTFTDDGWFRTGDLGYLDSDGYLHVSGRVSTMIVTEGGENVQPDQVEDAYAESPAIREMGVLEEEGRLVALVLPETRELQGHTGDGDGHEAVRQAIEHRSRELPSYWRVSDFAVTRQSLPRTRLGKIQRHKLREQYETAKEGQEEEDEQAGPISVQEMSGEDRAVLEDPAARATWETLAERFSNRRLTPDTNVQLDLGIDSLEWVNLSLEIRRRAGVELDEEAIGRIETVRDVLHEVTEKSAAGGEVSGSMPLDEPEEALSDQQRRHLKPHGRVTAAAARSLFEVDRLLMQGVFQVESSGAEDLPDEPLVFTPNHTSHLDAPALAKALGIERLRDTYWGGWTGMMFANPLTRKISRLAHVIPVDPKRAAISSLAFAAAVLRAGKSLVWFPEGERSADGELQSFKPGIGMVLARYPRRVVPVRIEGAHAALPRDRWIPRPKKIRVVFGEPLDVKTLEEQGRGDEPHERIASALRDEVARLADRRGE